MYNIPYMSFRIMSDTPGANEDNFSQYMDFWKSIADSSFAVCKSFLSELDNTL
jgi:adenosylhomocysteine nucleosidase